MSNKDLNYLSDMLNLEMDKLLIWFKANKLSLNLKKTTFTVFKPRQKHSICNIQISIDNQNIVKLKETNFLGVIQMSLRMLYYSLIYPYFYYCNIVWASTKPISAALLSCKSALLELLINHISMLIQTPSLRTSVY